MSVLDKAVQRFGFEDSRTIAIATLMDLGHSKLAEELWLTLIAE